MGFKHGLRNFWMNAEIHGRESDISGGPTEDGAMRIELKMLVGDRPVHVLTIDCKVRDDGQKTIRVHHPYLPDGVTLELEASVLAADGTLESIPPSTRFEDLYISTRK